MLEPVTASKSRAKVELKRTEGAASALAGSVGELGDGGLGLAGLLSGGGVAADGGGGLSSLGAEESSVGGVTSVLALLVGSTGGGGSDRTLVGGRGGLGSATSVVVGVAGSDHGSIWRREEEREESVMGLDQSRIVPNSIGQLVSGASLMTRTTESLPLRSRRRT